MLIFASVFRMLSPIVNGSITHCYRAEHTVEMAASVTDEMLETFVLIGKPEEVATKMKARCGGKMDRVSPVIYQPNTEFLKAF